jgi:hypothetical protein
MHPEDLIKPDLLRDCQAESHPSTSVRKRDNPSKATPSHLFFIWQQPLPDSASQQLALPGTNRVIGMLVRRTCKDGSAVFDFDSSKSSATVTRKI